MKTVIVRNIRRADGMFGDLLATSLMARGVTGLVLDVKSTLGAVNIPGDA